MIYFLNIGSNLGNRRLHLSRALRALEARYGYFETSHMVDSAPWGYESANRFSNLGVMIVTDDTPEQVLEAIREIESELNRSPHRHADGTYADREVDIDIIAADDLVISTDTLTIPHPRMASRRFVLEPLAELAPLWRHPLTGLTPAQMLAQLPPDQ